MAKTKTPLQQADAAFMPALWIVIGFSFFINLLMFVSPLYMLQVYDRVLTSRNTVTLLMLTIIAAGLLGTYGLLEYLRSRVLNRAGNRFDEVLAKPVFHAILTARLKGGDIGIAQSMRDVGSIRDFLTGSPIAAFCDAPWVPLFLAAVFILHPWLGMVALLGAVLIFLTAIANEILTRDTLKASNSAGIVAQNHVQSSSRNAEIVKALGMRDTLTRFWESRHNESVALQTKAADRSGALISLQRFIRMGLQVGILGVGAYLAVDRQISPGTMIAASIIMGRALQPVEQSVSSWRGFLMMRQARERLHDLFDKIDEEVEVMDLPRPKGRVMFENVYAMPPGVERPLLQDVSFLIEPGECFIIVGPSAAGKSSIARLLTGVWPVMRGHVRIDGADISHWDPEKLGQHIGYLPQDVELFSGSVAENIARLQKVDNEKVLAAAEAAGVHALIQQLPEGYDTPIGEEGMSLSGGQRQRIGLARALYDDPALIVLDEPNASLDTAGEEALAQTIRKLHGKATVVIISHKPNVLSLADRIMVLDQGRIKMMDTRDEILPKLIGPPRGAAPGPQPKPQPAAQIQRQQPATAPRAQPATPAQPASVRVRALPSSSDPAPASKPEATSNVRNLSVTQVRKPAPKPAPPPTGTAPGKSAGEASGEAGDKAAETSGNKEVTQL